MTPSMLSIMPHRRFLFLLTILLVIEFVVCAIAPYDRKDWLLENVLVVLFVGAMYGSYRKLTLSRISYLLIFLFLSLHLVGAHYTYAQVPYDHWFESLTGRTFNEPRRLGAQQLRPRRALCLRPAAGLSDPRGFLRVARLRGFWGYFLPLDLTMSTSMLYELIEWAAAACSAAIWARPTSARRATSGMRTRTWRSPASAR